MKPFYEYCNGSRIEVKIPNSFVYIEGEVANGLVIEDEAGNQFIRIPTGYTPSGEFVKGFWISRFEISLDEDENPHSVANKYPIVNVGYHLACILAQKVDDGYILSGREYDRICMWLVETGVATFEQVFVKGNGMGNYSKPFVLAKTGTNPEWMKNRLDNFWGNCYIWTTERSELYAHYRVIRGGNGAFDLVDDNYPASCRSWNNPNEGRNYITFRICFR